MLLFFQPVNKFKAEHLRYSDQLIRFFRHMSVTSRLLFMFHIYKFSPVSFSTGRFNLKINFLMALTSLSLNLRSSTFDWYFSIL